MAEKDTGGPAFPPHHHFDSMQGMTLRDWFAGQALASIAGRFQTSDPKALDKAAKACGYSGPLDGFIALQAYALADAMLAERNK